MKNLFLISVAGIMMMTACSRDGEGDSGYTNTGGESEIIVSLSTGGDRIARAARPVESSEARNNVQAVKISVYDNAGVDKTSEALAGNSVVTWSAGPSDAGAPGTLEHKGSQTLKLKKLVANTTYTVVAYGYNDVADYAVTNGGNTDDAFTATFSGTTGDEAEFFAGKSTFTTNADGVLANGVTCEVVMLRQIAGLLGYVKNIPILYPNADNAPIAVRYVRVYASSRATTFTFPSALDVNGAGNSTKTKVLEYDLQTLLGADYSTQVTAAGTDFSKTFTVAAKNTTTLKTEVNSLLGGAFVIPFAAIAGVTTFTVELYPDEATGGANALKVWNVVAKTASGSSTALPADAKVYPVERNKFYSIGQKLRAASTSDPDEPTKDIDDAIDLSKEITITVTINDAWDVIYQMGIEG